MSIAAYPSPDLSASNPKYGSFISLPDEYQVTTSEYDDGGRDYALQSGGTPIKIWQIEYPTLTLAQAAILDAHVNSASYSPDKGSARNFSFTDRDTSITYTGVRYASGGYSRSSHKIKYLQSRSIILVKYPA